MLCRSICDLQAWAYSRSKLQRLDLPPHLLILILKKSSYFPRTDRLGRRTVDIDQISQLFLITIQIDNGFIPITHDVHPFLQYPMNKVLLLEYLPIV